MDYLYDKVDRVPTISDAKIAEMRHIEPLILGDDGMYRRIQGVGEIHPRNISFLWDAKPTGDPFAFETLNETTILTQHHSSVFFKPSLAEVYAWLRFYAGNNWHLFKFFCMGDVERVGASTDYFCKCRIMGGRILVRGREIHFASGKVGHELVEAS